MAAGQIAGLVVKFLGREVAHSTLSCNPIIEKEDDAASSSSYIIGGYDFQQSTYPIRFIILRASPRLVGHSAGTVLASTHLHLTVDHVGHERSGIVVLHKLVAKHILNVVQNVTLKRAGSVLGIETAFGHEVGDSVGERERATRIGHTLA